jgi:FkbM family methyltransferase
MSVGKAAPSFSDLTGQALKHKVVDVGAYFMGGNCVYEPLLENPESELIGFEANPDALSALQNPRDPRRTFLPLAVGDGTRRPLYFCAAKDMTSLLEPNPNVLNLFHGFPIWGEVVATESVQTVRLDDVAEIAGLTFLQMDIQGAELLALQHAENRLREALVLHLEVEFLQLYTGQPLFSDVEQFLRHRGYLFHRFFEPTSRAVQPMLLGGDIRSGLGQLVWSDAVFIRDFSRLDRLDDRELLVTAAIMHDCYNSWDLAQHLLLELDRRTEGTSAPEYLAALRCGARHGSELASVA